MVESIPGPPHPKTLGRSARRRHAGRARRAAPARRAHRCDEPQRSDACAARSPAASPLLGGARRAALGWRAGRKIEQPISALIRSADRIGQGDYTRPLESCAVTSSASCSRRSSACAASCARARSTRTTSQRPQQHDGRGVRHLARRRHQDGERRGLQAARLRRRGDARPQHHGDPRRARARRFRPAAGRAGNARDRRAHAQRRRRFRFRSPARRSRATIRSSRATSSSPATSRIASAPSGASAISRGTTR